MTEGLGMIYDKTERKVPTRGPVASVPDTDRVIYPSLSHVGLEAVDLPVRDPSRSFEKVEKVLACNIGRHISTKLEADLRHGREAHETLAWYTGCLRANELLDGDTQAHLEKLSRKFASSTNQAEVFINEVEPFLAGLRSQRRS